MRRIATILLAATAILGSACATAHGPRRIDARASSPQAASDWTRVSQLMPGAVITLTTTAASSTDRAFVNASPSSLVTLDLAAAAINDHVRHALRGLVAEHAAAFETLPETGMFRQDDVSIGRDGLFVGDRKLAELDAVLRIAPRADVVEIRGPVVARGSVGGTILGGWIGFAVGVIPGLGGASTGTAVAVLVGSIGAGGWLGYHFSSHQTTGLVYHAP